MVRVTLRCLPQALTFLSVCLGGVRQEEQGEQGLLLTWHSPGRPSEPLVSASLQLPSSGVIVVSHYAALFVCLFLHMGSGDGTQVLMFARQSL